MLSIVGALTLMNIQPPLQLRASSAFIEPLKDQAERNKRSASASSDILGTSSDHTLDLFFFSKNGIMEPIASGGIKSVEHIQSITMQRHKKFRRRRIKGAYPSL